MLVSKVTYEGLAWTFEVPALSDRVYFWPRRCGVVGLSETLGLKELRTMRDELTEIIGILEQRVEAQVSK